MGRELMRRALCTLAVVTIPAGLPAQFPVPSVAFSPDHSKFLMQEPSPGSDAPAAAEPTITVAGRQLGARSNTRPGIPTYGALVVQPIGRGETRRVVIPWKARVAYTMWAPGSDRVAFMVVEEAGLSLWVAEPYSGESRMLAGPVLNGAFGNPCQWLPNGSGLICRRLAPAAATGPDSLVHRCLPSRLTLYPLSGAERGIGAPGLIQHHDLAPDGRFLLVETLRPDGGSASEVWDISGAAGDPGVRAVPPGGRTIGWRDDEAATLFWTEARSDGAGERVMTLAAPFTGQPVVLARLEGSLTSVIWGRHDVAVLNERVGGTGRNRSWLVDPSQPAEPLRLLPDSASFVLGAGPRGRQVLVTSRDGRFAFLAGVGGASEGRRPFLDRIELPSRRRFRLWRSEGATAEEALAVVDPESYRIITRREAVPGVGDYFIRDLRKTGAGQLTRLTRFGN